MQQKYRNKLIFKKNKCFFFRKTCKIESTPKNHFILPKGSQRIFAKFAMVCICGVCLCVFFVYFAVKNTFRRGLKIVTTQALYVHEN